MKKYSFLREKVPACFRVMFSQQLRVDRVRETVAQFWFTRKETQKKKKTVHKCIAVCIARVMIDYINI